MTRLFTRLVRAWARRLQTGRAEAGWWSRCWRGVLLVPPFALLVAWLRARLFVLGPLRERGIAAWGATFRCALPDLIQMYIHLFGLWEPDLTAFLQRRLRAGDVFIDVGANVGYYALLAARCVGSLGRVVAIDASPSLCAELRENVAANDVDEIVRIVNRAVSDHEHAVTIFAGPRHNVGLATTVAHRGGTVEAEVEAAPLADLLEADEIRRARVVKIDVEGAEPAVIRGLASFVAACPEGVIILIELSPTWWSERDLSPDAALRPLLDAGFHAYEVPNNYWPWRYLWPARVAKPRRVRRPLDRSVPRLDLVLSREDCEEL